MIESWLGRRFPLLAFARSNLSRARARTVLAMAGITIGVVAIASLGMFGVAFEQSMLDQASGFTKTVYVTAGEDADEYGLTREDVAAIEQRTSHPAYSIQQEQASVSAMKTQTSATVYGVSDPREFVTARSGRIPANWRSGALVGPTLAEDLDVRAGDSVVVNGDRHRVAAVLAEKGRSSFLQTDDGIMLPPTKMDSNRYDAVIVRTPTPSEAFRTSDHLERSLNPGRDELYAVDDAEQAIERFNSQMAQINTFLLAIGGVSLLVASVSIFNVMLMSAIERKEEIGVLRAVGYHRLDVLRLMLNEAVLLGVAGALAGVVLSVLLGMAINAEFLSDPLAFTAEALQYTVIGFLFGSLASFLSGLYPAWKAANARPVEALRD